MNIPKGVTSSINVARKLDPKIINKA